MSSLVAMRARWGTGDVRVILAPDDIEDLRRGLADGTTLERETLGDGQAAAEVGVGPTSAGWALRRGAHQIWSGEDHRELRRRVCSEVHLALAATSTDLVFVHAGAVVVHGLGVLIPGRSMAGKTSLVAALVERGAQYLSDEYAVLDRSGRVHPYVKPMSVRSGEGASRVDPPTASIARLSVPVFRVIDTRYEPAAMWSPDRRTGADVVLPLLDNAVAAQIRPDLVLDAATAVANSGAVRLSGVRGEASLAAEAIISSLIPTPTG